jgi:GR25 family glycosyltransferase involved in LPS biosynthesis
VKAYVINLARSPDRRAHMVSQLRRTGMEYEFIEAIDGCELDLDDSDIVSPASLGRGQILSGDRGGDRSWSGVVGCALSHLKAYQKILYDGADAGLVLEDDVTLPSDIQEIAAAAAVHMAGADVVLLHYGNVNVAYSRGLRLSRTTAVQLTGPRILAFPAEIADVSGAGAYLVTREACEFMTREVLPVRVPADDWAFFFARDALRSVRCVAPIPVEIDPKFRTTIDHVVPWSLQTFRHKAADTIPFVRQALTRHRQRVNVQVEMVDRPSDQLGKQR